MPVLLTEHHTMKACRWSGSTAPCILDHGTRWRSVVSFTIRPLCPKGKMPCYPMHRRLGGLQSRSRLSGEEKNSLPLPALKALIIQTVAQRYPGSLEDYRTWKICKDLDAGEKMQDNLPVLVRTSWIKDFLCLLWFMNIWEMFYLKRLNFCVLFSHIISVFF
jgi:hypothetical protein